MINRLRLQRDPALYGPSYAVLLGAFVSSAIGFGLSQAEIVRDTAQLVIGVTLVLTGLHLVVYRHEHTEVMKGRFGLAYYRPYFFVLMGVTFVFIGVAVATFAYLALAR